MRICQHIVLATNFVKTRQWLIITPLLTQYCHLGSRKDLGIKSCNNNVTAGLVTDK